MNQTDEERFHNGDTLPDGIPVIRDTTLPPPPGGFPRPIHAPMLVPDNRPQKRRLDSLSLISLGAAVFAVVFVGLLVAKQNQNAPAPQEAQPQPVTSTLSPTVPETVPPEGTDFNQPLMVNIVSEPATGGDPSTTFCLAWLSSGSGSGRDATMLMNAPGYQCDADLVAATTGQVHGPYGVLYDTPTECAAPDAYPAMLNDLWGSSAYVCLLDHNGA